MGSYVNDVVEQMSKRYPWEKEFLQAVREVLGSLDIAVERDPKYRKAAILERLIEPERVIIFVVSRDHVRVAESPISDSNLTSRVRLARDLLGRPEWATPSEYSTEAGRRAAEDVGLYELPPQTQKSIAGLIKYSFKDMVVTKQTRL